MLLRIGSTIAATITFAVMGTGVALWGINILPSEPLRVGFVVLVVIACLAGLRVVARDPRVLRVSYTRARAAQVPEPMLVSIPSTSPLGICWQCGSAVRAENLVCWKCGATQPQQRDLLPPIVPGKETDWDRSETVYRVPEPDVLPTSSLPVYRVDAPDGWNEARVDVPDGWSDVDPATLDAPPPAGERWLPAPLMAPVQVFSTGSIYESEAETPQLDAAPEQPPTDAQGVISGSQAGDASGDVAPEQAE